MNNPLSTVSFGWLGTPVPGTHAEVHPLYRFPPYTYGVTLIPPTGAADSTSATKQVAKTILLFIAMLSPAAIVLPRRSATQLTRSRILRGKIDLPRLGTCVPDR